MLQKILGTEDVFVRIEAAHSCIHVRGVKQIGASTVTQEATGFFSDPVGLGQYLHKL